MRISLNLYKAQTFGKSRNKNAKIQDAKSKNMQNGMQNGMQNEMHHQGYDKSIYDTTDKTPMSAYGIHPSTTVYGWKEVSITDSKEKYNPPIIRAKEPKPPLEPDTEFDGPGKVAHKFKTPQSFIKYHLDSLTEVSREVGDIYDSLERIQEKSRSYRDLIYNGINWLNVNDLCTLPKRNDYTDEERLYISLLYSYFSQNYEGGPVNGYERPPFIKSVKQSMDDAVAKEDTCRYLHHFLFNIQYLLPSEIYDRVEDEYDYEIKEGARISAENERYYEQERTRDHKVFDYMDYYGY